MPGSGHMGGRFNSRTKSVSVRNVGPRGRYMNNSAASDVLQDSEVCWFSVPRDRTSYVSPESDGAPVPNGVIFRGRDMIVR